MGINSPLPTEVWQIILRYAISVPVFLDPYEVSNYSFRMSLYPRIEWNNEAPYWAAERTRNSLQRVCRSWDGYLQRYKHRYVRIVDVAHEVVPLGYIETAVRIAAGPHPLSLCEKCRPGNYIPTHLLEQGVPFGAICLAILERVENSQATIVHFRAPSAQASEAFLNGFRNLVTCQAIRSPYRPSGFASLLNLLPNVHYWYAPVRFDEELDQGISSASLRALHLCFSQVPSPELFNSAKWNLPSLQHLCISVTNALSPSQLLISLPLLLEALGKRIQFLDIPRMRVARYLPDTLWSLCPKLECLKSSIFPVAPPPHNHPLNKIILPVSCFIRPARLTDSLPEWYLVGSVQMDRRWYDSTQYLRRSAIPPGLRLVDGMGESFEDYLRRTSGEAQN